MALEAHLIDQDAGVSLQTSERDHQVLVNSLDFPDSSGVLKLLNIVFLDSKDDAVGTSNGNGGTATVHGLKGVLHLEELTVRRENCVRLVVRWHLVC